MTVEEPASELADIIAGMIAQPAADDPLILISDITEVVNWYLPGDEAAPKDYFDDKGTWVLFP